MLNNSGNSRMDTLLKIVLIFVMSVLSFSIGAFVGKQVSDTEYRQAMLESEHGMDRSTASVDPHATKQKPDNALSEEDIASLTEEFVNVEKKSLEQEHQKPEHKDTPKKAHHEVAQHTEDGYKKLNHEKDNLKAEEHHNDDTSAHHKADAEEHSAAEAHDSHSKNKPSHAEKNEPPAAKPHKSAHSEKPSKAADRVAHDQAPTKDPEFKREPTGVLPTTPASSIGKYTVQIASYATEQEAKNHALKLKTKGYSAFYIPANVRGQTWYRSSSGASPL